MPQKTLKDAEGEVWCWHDVVPFVFKIQRFQRHHCAQLAAEDVERR